MATKNVTDENFETEVLKASKPTLVDFWAEWCGPCKQLSPIIEEISNEMKDQVFIATMLIFKNGELKATKVGATTKSNIVSWIKENL